MKTGTIAVPDRLGAPRRLLMLAPRYDMVRKGWMLFLYSTSNVLENLLDHQHTEGPTIRSISGIANSRDDLCLKHRQL